MRVIQVVPDVYNESAGPAISVPATTCGLIHNGVDAELWTLGELPKRSFNCPVRVFPIDGGIFRSARPSSSMLEALKKAALEVDIIHTNSIWMFANVYQSWAVRHTNCKTVIGPRGTVSKWALSRSRLKKCIFGHIWQYPAMRAADMFVASCQEEANDLRRLGYKQPIAIVSNGVDVPRLMPSPQKIGRRRMFFLSRIHPKKNVELLLRCWSKLEHDYPDWDLSIVGPIAGNEYAESMKKLSMELACKRVSFEGEINGSEKMRFMAESECMVFPTHSENFGMVVAESLACGTPVICSRGAPWGGLVDNDCGWWIPTDEDSFLNVIKHVMSLSRERLFIMGKNGREWMKRSFAWDGIAHDLKLAYEWLLGNGSLPCPRCVRID